MTNPNISEYGKEHRFKPGNKGGGRKLGSVSIVTKLKKLCAQHSKIKNPQTGQIENKSNADLVALSLMKQAVKGNIRAITTIMEYTDGKPAQTNIHTGVDGNPITHEVKVSLSEDHWNSRVGELFGGKSE